MLLLFFFFFIDSAPTEIYTLSLHDALPICAGRRAARLLRSLSDRLREPRRRADVRDRSEEHTSELQSRGHLVCRLLLEKKKYTSNTNICILHACHGGIGHYHVPTTCDATCY